MQNEIKILNDKVDDLNNERRRLNGHYTRCTIENLNLQSKLDTCESEIVTIIDSWQSKLNQCESANQDGVISRKELEQCREELTNEQNSKDKLNQNLQRTIQSLEAAKDQNDKLKNQLTLEKAENENRLNRIQQLEVEKSRMQTQSARNQTELKNKIRDLTNQNQNNANQLQNRLVTEKAENDNGETQTLF